MSFWDDIKNFTKPYGADEDYDDYDDEEEMDDVYEEEEVAAPRFARREKKAAAPAASEPSFTGSTSSATSVFTPVSGAAASTSNTNPTGFSSTVINTGSSNKQQVILTRPENFNDATVIATNLRAKKAVVLNLEGVNKDLARRMVDFLSGAIYCLDGSATKIAQSTYLFCPFNMEVLGDLNNLQSELDNYV